MIPYLTTYNKKIIENAFVVSLTSNVTGLKELGYTKAEIIKLMEYIYSDEENKNAILQ